MNEDERGTFVEMLKTKDTGQFSFFTAHPGVTRGGHYHNTKTEKFLILKGKGRGNYLSKFSDVFLDIEEVVFLELSKDWDLFYSELEIILRLSTLLS